jgi:hypothetical protein
MSVRHLASGGGLLLCLLAAAGCGSRAAPAPAAVSPPAAVPPSAAVSPARSWCATGSAFELSLASGRGGQRTPVAAAAWFARHGGVPGIPDAGWREISRAARGATLRSGAVTLQATQGPDRTWQIDGGRRCS